MGDLKNSLITKLIANVNFVIFHEKVFLVKLSISLRRHKVLLLRFRKNHKSTGFKDFWSEYILKNLPGSILVKIVLSFEM